MINLTKFFITEDISVKQVAFSKFTFFQYVMLISNYLSIHNIQTQDKEELINLVCSGLWWWSATPASSVSSASSTWRGGTSPPTGTPTTSTRSWSPAGRRWRVSPWQRAPRTPAMLIMVLTSPGVHGRFTSRIGAAGVIASKKIHQSTASRGSRED